MTSILRGRGQQAMDGCMHGTLGFSQRATQAPDKAHHGVPWTQLEQR